MEQVNSALKLLKDLCTSTRTFQQGDAALAIYRSPIIDYRHPDGYGQKGIAGLSKFLSHAETERDHVSGLFESGIPPRELTTNAPHMIAVWDEFLRAPWPLVCISQSLECGSQGTVRVDVVADGGDQWIKVNTIKVSRLLAEFREQDSYVNSDYDSDTLGESSSTPYRLSSPPLLSNSIISQVQALVRGAAACPRPIGHSPPRVRYVLTRMGDDPIEAYDDPRIQATFQAVRDLGVDLIFGLDFPQADRISRKPLRPSNRILLDLSVVVALCCDSTHHPLPSSVDETEARFRPLQTQEDGRLALAPHINVTRDLRDQLQWESQHPLIDELILRLSEAGYAADDVEWFVTQEVKDRAPGIIDVIGGPNEKARAKCLLGDGPENTSFWEGSRYDGRTGVLKDIKLKILDDKATQSFEHAVSDQATFRKGMEAICERMLSVVDGMTSTPSTSSRAPSPGHRQQHQGRKSRNPRRPQTVFPPNSRLLSSHTLRTFLIGARNDMTVLTNNRGALGKVIREMGVQDGLPNDRQDDGIAKEKQEWEQAAVWAVNPSSLAEWRRVEVEETNRALTRASSSI